MRKEATFLVAAALLHAGIPLVARLFAHADAGSHARFTALHPMEVVVEIPVEPLQEAPPPAPIAPREPSNDPAPPAPEARAATATTPRAPGGPIEPQTGPEPVATAAPVAAGGHAPDQYDAPEGPGAGDGIVRVPGIGNPIWTVPGTIPPPSRAAPAPTVATGPPPVDKDIAGIVMRGAMREADSHLGLDLPGQGTVRSAVKSAMQGGDVPNEGRASFEVRVGPDGRVLGVRVGGTSGGNADMWARKAKEILAMLSGRPLQMNSNFAKGAIISVSVVSTMALPSGAGSAVSQEGSGIKFDTSDIGAHKSRSVKASVHSEPVR
ncbi:MAG: hypothetical protein ABJE95_20420 [Byssovorax sp.]